MSMLNGKNRASGSELTSKASLVAAQESDGWRSLPFQKSGVQRSATLRRDSFRDPQVEDGLGLSWAMVCSS